MLGPLAVVVVATHGGGGVGGCCGEHMVVVVGQKIGRKVLENRQRNRSSMGTGWLGRGFKALFGRPAALLYTIHDLEFVSYIISFPLA